jgi:hypothetical protein
MSSYGLHDTFLFASMRKCVGGGTNPSAHGTVLIPKVRYSMGSKMLGQEGVLLIIYYL